jgi:predicted metalloendopeptidase
MDVRYINTEIDPRDDFYGFAAGRWSEYNEQPADEPAWSNFEVVEERVTERLRDMLKSLDESDAMQRKIAAYQRIYTNYERRNR